MVGNSGPFPLQAVNLALFTHTKFTLVFKEVALLILFTFSSPHYKATTGHWKRKGDPHIHRQKNSRSISAVSKKYYEY